MPNGLLINAVAQRWIKVLNLMQPSKPDKTFFISNKLGYGFIRQLTDCVPQVRDYEMLKLVNPCAIAYCTMLGTVIRY
jgi:hypothetical protein